MRKFIAVAISIAVLIGMSACASTDAEIASAPAAEVPAFAPLAEAKALDEPVANTSCNRLADKIGSVVIVIDKDTSYTSNDEVKGATIQMVEYLGKKAIKVTKNTRNEIRIAFVLDKPTRLAGFSTLEFTVAGFEGWGGAYNCGLLYTAAKSSGERLGSFYVGSISNTVWTTVQANLAYDEQWGSNFSPDKELYCLQFWTSQARTMYIADLALK